MSPSISDYLPGDKSLGVGMTTIAEGTVSVFRLYTTGVILNTTIGGVIDLCVVKCGSFLELPSDHVECVHD